MVLSSENEIFHKKKKKRRKVMENWKIQQPMIHDFLLSFMPLSFIQCHKFIFIQHFYYSTLSTVSFYKEALKKLKKKLLLPFFLLFHFQHSMKDFKKNLWIEKKNFFRYCSWHELYGVFCLLIMVYMRFESFVLYIFLLLYPCILGLSWAFLNKN